MMKSSEVLCLLLLNLTLIQCHFRHDKNRNRNPRSYVVWPVKRVAEIPGDILLGGLHMIHERQDQLICGPVMPQGGLQAAEVMLFTIDKVNQLKIMPNEVTLGTQILDDCDKDTYGLQQAVDFIKGTKLWGVTGQGY